MPDPAQLDVEKLTGIGPRLTVESEKGQRGESERGWTGVAI